MRDDLWTFIAFTLAIIVIAVNIYRTKPAAARDYCPVEPYMRTTQGCARIPTAEVPKCPATLANRPNGLIDSTSAYLVDSTGTRFKW